MAEEKKEGKGKSKFVIYGLYALAGLIIGSLAYFGYNAWANNKAAPPASGGTANASGHHRHRHRHAAGAAGAQPQPVQPQPSVISATLHV